MSSISARFDARAAVRLEKTYSTPEIVAQRARTREALAATNGERGLEIGCGPGLLTCELAREVGGSGRIVAIDASTDMIAATRGRADHERLSDRVRLVHADAAALPFSRESFDFVVVVQVYLFVDDIAAALADAARVLRPGGRLVVVDTDWDSCIWLSSDRTLTRRMLDAGNASVAQPHLPSRLPGLLQAAGFVLKEVGAISIINTRYDPDSFSGSRIESLPRVAIANGIAPEDAERWAMDLRSRTGEGEYFFSVTRHLFVGINR